MNRPCTTCRWCDWPEFATGIPVAIEVTAACMHPKARATVSRITGGHGDARPCALMRTNRVVYADAECGPNGDLWEGNGKGQAVMP